MAIKKFEFDLYFLGGLGGIMDIILEGVMTNVEVDTETNEVTIEYAEQDSDNEEF